MLLIALVMFWHLLLQEFSFFFFFFFLASWSFLLIKAFFLLKMALGIAPLQAGIHQQKQKNKNRKTNQRKNLLANLESLWRLNVCRTMQWPWHLYKRKLFAARWYHLRVHVSAIPLTGNDEAASADHLPVADPAVECNHGNLVQEQQGNKEKEKGWGAVMSSSPGNMHDGLYMHYTLQIHYMHYTL